MEEHGSRYQLNEFLQRKYGSTDRLDWEENQKGSGHRPRWEFRAILDGYEIGRGEGPSKGAAKEAASAQALEHLRRLET
ncbi:hypothetical protein EDC04DRAFT_2674928 [Pisolithus marmoratus]|nr:hypothetical protein EDC04DRAFT_2674928 [Pisolithus marmoratus]